VYKFTFTLLLCVLFSCSDDNEAPPSRDDTFHISYGFPYFGRHLINLAPANGGYLLAVNQIEVPSNFPDYKIGFVRLNETGEVQWSKKIASPSSPSFELLDLQSVGASYLLLGEVDQVVPFVADVTADGVVVNAHKYTSSKGVTLQKCVLDETGNRICSGMLYNDGNPSTLLLKITPTGEVTWGREIREEPYRSLAAVRGENIYVAVNSTYYLTNTTVYKFNALGNLLGQVTIVRPSNEITVEKVVPTENGIYLCFRNSRLSRSYIVKMNENLQVEKSLFISSFHFTDLVDVSGHFTLTGFREGETRVVELDYDLVVQRENTIANLVGALLTLNAQVNVNDTHLAIGLSHISVYPDFVGSEINIIRVRTSDLKPRCSFGDDDYLPTTTSLVTFETSLSETEVLDFLPRVTAVDVNEEALEVASFQVCQ